MSDYKHSVSLDVEKCKGCTHCLKRCPTEAIRIRDGHAKINADRCIDCGVCIRICPYKAKKAIFDKPEVLQPYKWKIALPPPSLYGQFENLDDVDYVLQGLLDCGFDEVFEVARAAELVTAYTRRYLKRDDIQRPVISSACPVIVRLIAQRFPLLCSHLMPLLPPMEIAAIMAKEQAQKAHPELKEEEIGICFISPCPAKISDVKNGIGGEKSHVNVVVSMADMYFSLISVMSKDQTPPPVSKAGMIGIGWASAGGEATAIFNDRYLAADGIENVIRVLDDIENGTMPNLDFIELNACNGGCVGGAMTVANPYIAKTHLQNLRRYLPVSQNHIPNNKDERYIPESFFMKETVTYHPAVQLNQNRKEAMKMMADIQQIHACLPDLDCGSCGSPTCHAFAEDVVKGETEVDQCVVKMREKIKERA
jgi:Na+-translocating ferredoxin:NAD+ oxidoreductase RNF subunit RnfB